MSNDQVEKKGEEKKISSSSSGGGINSGVAVVACLLSFLAGGLLIWGYAHRNGGGGLGITAEANVKAGWSDEGSPVPISSQDPMWGDRQAPVSIVVFSDFQCPFCSRVEPTLEQIKTTYGKDKVRIVWKNEPLPFHEKAKPAAEAAQGVFEMAGNTAFWKFHDMAFKNQNALGRQSYEEWAKQAGVTQMEAYKQGLDSHKWAAKVDKDHAVARQVGVNGTPASYINGIAVSGAQPFDKFKAIIDDQLVKAKAKLSSGTSSDKLYVALSTENYKNAPKPSDDEEDEKPDTTIYKAVVGAAPTLGKADALVTIVEFSDFQCPYCARVEPTLSKVRETYGDKVRLVWKHEPLPFHNRAIPAANLAMEARAQKGDKGFWEAHDKLFASQKSLEDSDLETIGKDMGLNVEKVKAAIKDNKYKKEIDADADLADDLAASGTPHFFINGRRLVGAQPIEKFKAIIDEEMKKAEAMAKNGTPSSKVYDEIMKTAKGAPEPEKKIVANAPTGAPYKGNDKAKVVIYQFSDFQCPFCSRVEPTVNEVMKNYGDKVKLVWRDKPLPMHPDAPLAAEAAREALKQKGPDGFWKFHAKLFENQKGEGLKRPALEKYAEELGLNMDKFKVALDSHAHKPAVDAESKVADDAGISGTPAFLVNGYFISGAQPYTKFRKTIDLALAEAK